MKTRIPKLRLLYVVLSFAFLAKVLVVNLTYTKLQWRQEEAQQQLSQLEPAATLNGTVITSITTSAANNISFGGDNKASIPIPRSVRIEQQRQLEKRRQRMNTTMKEKLRDLIKNKRKKTKNVSIIKMNKNKNSDRSKEQQQQIGDHSTRITNHQQVQIIQSHQDQNQHTPHSKYAYAFLIGGVHEERPAYRGFLYNVLIAAYLLHISGSTMDIIVYIQLSPDSTLQNTLPTYDLQLVSNFNQYIKSNTTTTTTSESLSQQQHDRISIKFVDRPTGNKESFSELVYDKFRILQLVQYDRVMFLDGDVIPLTNLDYFFDLSTAANMISSTTTNSSSSSLTVTLPILQPNFIMASRGEPCNAGMFILQPMEGEWEQLQDVIHQQHVSAQYLPYPKFDREYGWGHSFVKSGDYWEGIVKNGTMWKYHASHSDQGLLYYWVKYVKQRVSIAVGDRLVEWIPSQPSASSKTTKKGTSKGSKSENLPIRNKDIYRGLHPFMVSKEPLAWQDKCDKNDASYHCTAPYREFAHFMGEKKPWQLGTGVSYFSGTSTKDSDAPYRLWFETLQILNTTLDMKLVPLEAMKDGIPELQKTPLGHMAMWKDHHERVNIKHSTNKEAKRNATSTTTTPSLVGRKDSGVTTRMTTTSRTMTESNSSMNDYVDQSSPRANDEQSTVVQPYISGNVTTQHSPYAYAFLIGGVHEHRPAYRGFLYDVLISAHILRKVGSTMDVWLFVQISPDSNLTKLPDEDARHVDSLNIRTRYVDKPKVKETFNELVYDKFRILQLTEYRRVMFLDADAIPLTNLDYMFRLSEGENPLLQPNFIVASRGEPCNAGLFILEPKDGEWENLQRVITKQHEDAKNLPYPKFDREYGWGHSFKKAGDQWEGIEQNGTMWKYHASHSDQGLLYFWVKYVKQNVSIAIGNKLVRWVPGQDGRPFRKEELHRALHPHMANEPLAWQFSCDRKDSYYCTAPYREYAHFMGGGKPWQKGNGLVAARGTSTSDRWAAYRLWFEELGEINELLGMGLDLSAMGRGIENMTETPLGHMAMWYDHSVRVEQLTQ